MTEQTFPAPTVAAPVLTAPDVYDTPEVEAPVAVTASADASRSTAEYARTVGATVPAGLTPAPVATPEGKVIVMPYAGHDFKVYPGEFTGEVYDWMTGGLATKAIKALIKDEQWQLIKAWHMRDLRLFMDAIGQLDLMGK